MPAKIRRLTAQGLVNVDFSADSLQEATKHEPLHGVYTVSNTYARTKTLLLDEHLDRLEDSAQSKGIPFKCDRTQLKSALRRMIVESEFGDARFRISVPADAPSEMILSIEPFQPPSPALIAKGARGITSSVARHNPASKSSEWMHRRQAVASTQPAGIYETFLLEENGALLEGASSNVYAILDGELLTASSGMLEGISRMIVLKVCREIIPLRATAPNISDIDRFSEAFLSSSSRGIIPVIEIDEMPIGDGRVGPTTLALRKAYQDWVADHLEEL
ncbi:MAG: aminotransferase class IV [Chloroflexota bacterium]|nr:aminotransferase class IV [Chloroflexota bacterium]